MEGVLKLGSKLLAAATCNTAKLVLMMCAIHKFIKIWIVTNL
jgi:hypothetical protein